MRFLTGFFFTEAPPGAQSSIFNLPKDAFNYQSDTHAGFITQQTERFSKALADLQTVDDHILMGTSIALGSWLTCGFLPLVTVGMAVSAYVGYCAHTRSEYARKYKEALEDLITVYQWAMGKGSSQMWYKLGNKEIQNLIVTLGPWVNTETILTWEKDDLKPSALAKITTGRRTDISEDMERQLLRLADGTHMSSVKFRLYGEGSVDKLLNSIKDNALEKVMALTTGYKS